MSIQNTVHIKAIGQKYDTEENWAKSNYIPIKGEIIIYSPNKIKIGDGITKVNDLPFVTENNSSSSATIAYVDNVYVDSKNPDVSFSKPIANIDLQETTLYYDIERTKPISYIDVYKLIEQDSLIISSDYTPKPEHGEDTSRYWIAKPTGLEIKYKKINEENEIEQLRLGSLQIFKYGTGPSEATPLLPVVRTYYTRLGGEDGQTKWPTYGGSLYFDAELTNKVSGFFVGSDFGNRAGDPIYIIDVDTNEKASVIGINQRRGTGQGSGFTYYYYTFGMWQTWDENTNSYVQSDELNFFKSCITLG